MVKLEPIQLPSTTLVVEPEPPRLPKRLSNKRWSHLPGPYCLATYGLR
jgi:hypothetical protein